MASSAFDYVTLGSEFNTPAMRAVWEERNLLQKWLDVEAALARAQAKVGMVPAEAAEEITRKAKAELVDLERVRAEIKRAGHLIVGVLRGWSPVIEHGAEKWVHYGASSPDVLDTGLALLLKEAVEVVQADLQGIHRLLIELTERHARTLMAGRTHGQHALPITFGFKLAIWLAEMGRHLDRLDACRGRVLVGNLTGAVGTQAAFGPRGEEIQRLALDSLGLGVPEIVTHMLQRDRHAELAGVLASVGSSLGKIAHEIYLLQKTEVGELSEGFRSGDQVGSSSLPQKRNPLRCENIWGIAKVLRGLSVSVLDAQEIEHENDTSLFAASFVALPAMFMLAARALHDTRHILKGLVVDQARMLANLRSTHGLIVAERVMIALAEKLGKPAAHRLVYEAAMDCYAKSIPLAEALGARAEVRALLTTRDLETLCDAETYIGTGAEQALDVARRARARYGA
ncbi:MAG: adenylosuccinate lyase [Candidatus Rokubacteria bacterium]|nr:adenylosuccinate lyase [Candidatus Rokubacteria bacterium]